MAPTARDRARAEFTADLLAAARIRLATDGAAQLSLRAVARDLGVASSAVYRYVESRDALLTLLIIEAYDEVGQTCERAADAARRRGAGPGETLLAVAHAFRGWALEHPHSYALVYGTPVPGYAAPQDTVSHAVRVWAVLVGVVVEAHGRPDLAADAAPAPWSGIVADDAVEFGRVTVAALTGGGDLAWGEAEVLACITLFTAILGAVTAELFGHLHRVVADHERGFDAVVRRVAAGLGLPVEPHPPGPDGGVRTG